MYIIMSTINGTIMNAIDNAINNAIENAIDNKFEIVLGVCLIVFIVIFVFVFLRHIRTNDDGKLITWTNGGCNTTINDSFVKVFDKYNIKYTDNTDNTDTDNTDNNYNFDLYLPCSYDNVEKEMSIMPIKKDAKYFIIDGCDSIVAKDWMWENLLEYYGDINKVLKLVPQSYILSNPNDIKRFNYDYSANDNKLYIMKKNIQRQEGLLITNNKNTITNGRNEKYVVVQELLQNPFTINSRKINMRFYVLVISKNILGDYNVFVHKNGFMYYTKVPFKKNSLEFDENITTGYIDRRVYDENPLTHDDMRSYLTINNYDSKQFFDGANKIIHDVFIAFKGKMCKNQRFVNNVTFQLFGVDMAVDDQLNCLCIEVNKGCDMGAKCERDSQVKQNVVSDVLTEIGLINKPNSDFVKII